jgi:AcrR family transcriptional regulator
VLYFPFSETTPILDVTERRVRLAGYNGFSFRDVAADAGIKSSSVHYHFPGKELLVDAIAERYTERAREWLGDQAEGAPTRPSSGSPPFSSKPMKPTT